MHVQTSYRGRSELAAGAGSAENILRFAPDLGRDRVRFTGLLAEPLRFREAISALHDVVIGDLRYKPRDKSEYEAWKANQVGRESAIRAQGYADAKAELAAAGSAMPADLPETYEAAKKRYWKARRGLNGWLYKNDKTLWRQLMPYDPVMTVAEDALLFEAFSADESSYGCLSVGRTNGFIGGDDATLGTTNVDYSWDLYDHFQRLRSYRTTRFNVDPEGFESSTGTEPAHFEEKIELPDGWLRGFSQMQAAMTLPMRRVSLSVASVYSLLAYLKRHKAKESPRALRFELSAGRAPKLLLEPWEKEIVSEGTTYVGPEATGQDAVRVWGRRRLLVLARVLPLADSVDVHLLGTGLPSFWVVRMGDMRLTLGLSGWTTNDWTCGSALDQFLPPSQPEDRVVAALAGALEASRSLDLAAAAKVVSRTLGKPSEAIAAAALNQLALRGQAIYDLTLGAYRWRQVLPMALSDRELGPSSEELPAAARLVQAGAVEVMGKLASPVGGTIANGRVEGKPCEVKFDETGRVVKGKCVCGHHYKFGLRNGPCRHIQALRSVVRGEASDVASVDQWFLQRSDWVGR